MPAYFCTKYLKYVLTVEAKLKENIFVLTFSFLFARIGKVNIIAT